MAMLMLTCKSCGKEFRSGINGSLQGFTAKNNTHQCTYCGAKEKYSTPDYHEATE